jgi:hypothetical protein
MRVTPQIERAALLLFLLAVLAPMLMLGLSSDDIGIAWTMQGQAHGLFSQSLWADPHYNRFPLNTAVFFGLHGSLLQPQWQAHAAMWALMAATMIALFAAIENPPWKLGGTLLLMTSWPLLLSFTDLACTHYLLCFFFFLMAILVRERRGGFYLSACLCGVSALCSEIGVFLAIQLILLEAAHKGGRLWERKRLAWLALAWLPFLLAKIAIFANGGFTALFWKAYPPRPLDFPFNIARGLRYLFFPFHALPLTIVGLLYGLLVAWAVVKLRRSRLSGDDPSCASLQPSARTRLCLFATAVLLSLFPFIFFERVMISPRLFSEALLMLVLWAPLVAADLRIPRQPLLALVALLLANQALFFQYSLREAVRVEKTFASFREQASESALAQGSFARNLVVAYRTGEGTPLSADWGMKLLFNDSALRQRLLDWPPLRANQKVAMAYGMDEKICLPSGLAPAETELLVFSDEPNPPTALALCDSACGACRNASPIQSIRALQAAR